MRPRHWYSRFGIEEPFPWIGVGIACVTGLLIELVVVAGVLQLFDCDMMDT